MKELEYEMELSRPEGLDLDKMLLGDTIKMQTNGYRQGSTDFLITKTGNGRFSIVRQYFYEVKK